MKKIEKILKNTTLPADFQNGRRHYTASVKSYQTLLTYSSKNPEKSPDFKNIYMLGSTTNGVASRGQKRSKLRQKGVTR